MNNGRGSLQYYIQLDPAGRILRICLYMVHKENGRKDICEKCVKFVMVDRTCIHLFFKGNGFLLWYM